MDININQTSSKISDLLSYGAFLNDIKRFRSSGTKGDEFNRFDTPAHMYFKLMFYFYNGDIDRPDNFLNSGGLLAPTWSEISGDDYHNYNSAWSYLKMNNEEERADKLRKFVELLSNISTNSPWYFQSIEGLDVARTRSQPQSNELKIDENRQKITIKCLNDSYDNRIGTLLDLYRDVVWSHIMKREIIPANLRKFDMGIYIFSSPISNIHNPQGLSPASVNSSSSNYITSYKYIELHNCEIDYNSGLQALPTLDNTEGVTPTHNIDIYFDDVYEESYNEFLMRYIGDMVLYDALSTNIDLNSGIAHMNGESIAQKDDESHLNELNKRIDIYENRPILDNPKIVKNKMGLLEGVVTEVAGFAVDRAKEFINNKLSGNIYGISPTKIIQQTKNLMDGKIFATVSAAKEYAEKLNKKQSSDNKELTGKIYPESTFTQNRVEVMGNIFKSKTMINNL